MRFRYFLAYAVFASALVAGLCARSQIWQPVYVGTKASGTTPSIALDSFQNLGDNGGSSTTFNSNFVVGSGVTNGLLMISFEGDVDGGADDITGVTFNGVAATFLTKVVNSGNGNRQRYTYGLLNPATGSHMVTVTAASAHYIIGVAASYSGVRQGGLPDSSNTAFTTGNTGAAATVSTTVIAPNSWLFLVCSNQMTVAGNYTAAGYTFRVIGNFSQIGILDSAGPVTSGSHSATVSQIGNTTANYSATLISIAP